MQANIVCPQKNRNKKRQNQNCEIDFVPSTLFVFCYDFQYRRNYRYGIRVSQCSYHVSPLRTTPPKITVAQTRKGHARVSFNSSSLTLTLSTHQRGYKGECRLVKEDIFLFFTDLRTLGVPYVNGKNSCAFI